MALTQYTGVLGKSHAAHLLRRACFGGKKEEIDTFSEFTPAQAIAQLFRNVEFPLPPIDVASGTSWVDLPPSDNDDDTRFQSHFKAWWLGQMLGNAVNDADVLPFLTRERIVFLLHTHIPVIEEVVNSSRALYFQNTLFRHYAFDETANLPHLNYKSLLKKICVDNAMLVLLDGRLNVRGRPNENFARELLELYSIGKGKPGSTAGMGGDGDYVYFTEQDVQAAARICSGYDFDNTFSNIDPETELPRAKVKLNAQLVANQHDNDPKEFSHRLGNAVITPNPDLLTVDGRATVESMLDEIDQLIELLFTQEETIRNICRRVYRFYVYHDINDTIENTIISDMVEILENNDYKLETLIKILLQSQHFYDSANQDVNDDNIGALIKSPIDMVTNTLRFFEYQLPDCQTQAADFYTKSDTLLRSIQLQGLSLLNPFDVAGYDAYFQFPLYNRHWISTNTLTQRYKFIYDILTVEAMPEPDEIHIDLLAFVQNRFAGIALNHEGLANAFMSYLLPWSETGVSIKTERFGFFVSRFMQLGTGLPQGAVAFWQFSYTNANTIEASREDARGMLQDLINAMLQSPEYQLF